MQVVTIIIIIILCIVAVQVVGVVVYFAAKRYYFDYIRRKMRFKRLEKLAMFIKIDRLKKQMKGGAQGWARKTPPEEQNRGSREQQRRRSLSLDRTVRVHEPETEEQNQAVDEQSHMPSNSPPATRRQSL